MKRINWLIFISLLLAVTVLACQPAGPQETEIFPATIQDIRVEVAETNPPQVMAYIKGPLPYTCTAVDELKRERSDSTVDITIILKTTPAEGCAKTDALIFTQNVNLGSDFVSGQTYTINVNDQTTSFVMASQPDDSGELVISPATIHEVRVAVAESYPPQVMVYIQGGLPDSCTEFRDLKTERSSNMVTITVTTQRPRDLDCSTIYRRFEENVNLGSDFVSGETYNINVNDQTTSFVME